MAGTTSTKSAVREDEHTVTLPTTDNDSSTARLKSNGSITGVEVIGPGLDDASHGLSVELLNSDESVVRRQSGAIEPGTSETAEFFLITQPWNVLPGMKIRVHVDTQQSSEGDFTLKPTYI